MAGPVRVEIQGAGRGQGQGQEEEPLGYSDAIRYLLFSIIYGIILPIDFHIFQDG